MYPGVPNVCFQPNRIEACVWALRLSFNRIGQRSDRGISVPWSRDSRAADRIGLSLGFVGRGETRRAAISADRRGSTFSIQVNKKHRLAHGSV